MIDTINIIIKALAKVVEAVIDLLPDSPFIYFKNVDNEILHLINWLFPIPEAIAHITTLSAAIGVYYVIRIILRWAKVVGS